MNSSNDGIVVYQSEAHRASDQWMWNGGGWQVVLIVILAMLVIVGILTLLDKMRGRHRW